MYHHYTTEVFYEDTDSLGMVYHANYLKFAERVRSQWLRRYLHPQALSWLAGQNIAFVVASLSIDYHRPAKLGDDLYVDFSPVEIRPARLIVSQWVARKPPQCSANRLETAGGEVAGAEALKGGRSMIPMESVFSSLKVRLALIDLKRGKPLAMKKKFPDFIEAIHKFL